MSELADLVRAGVSAGIASELVADGHTRRVAGHVVVVGLDEEPIIRRPQLYVAVGADAVVRDASGVAELRRYAARQRPRVERIMLRLAGTTPTDGLPGHAFLRYVTAPTAGSAEPPDAADWTVRRCEPEDQPEVIRLLCIALADGYRQCGEEATGIAPDVLREAAEEILARALDEGAVFTLHHAEHGFAGHATVTLEEDELRGEVTAELVDQFVLERWRGSGAARVLTSAAVRWAAHRGWRLRGHVVGHGEQPDAVLRRLVAAGWQHSETYWSLPIDRARPRAEP
jgi:GNAT superfamily N-acetyltransferase